MILETILYYVFYASIVLVYGIGITKVAEVGISQNLEIAFYIKGILTIIISSTISWFVTQNLLIPLKLLELAPLVIYLIFICVNSLLQTVIMIITGKNNTEFTVYYMIILLSIIESSSIFNTLLIILSCVLSLLLLTPLCYAFKTRLIANGHTLNEKYYSIFFLFLALLILITSTADIFWLNSGVLK